MLHVWCVDGHTSQEMYLFQETHIMHVFDEDFYGSELKVAMLGYIRGEKNFKSLGELSSHNDYMCGLMKCRIWQCTQ